MRPAALLALCAMVSAFPASLPASPARSFADRHPEAVLTLDDHGRATLVTGLSLELAGTDRAAAAAKLLQDESALLGFDPARSRVQFLADIEAGGVRAIRFGQRHQDLPVVGRDAVVAFDAAGRATMISSSLAAIGEVRAEFLVPEEAAQKAAREKVGVGPQVPVASSKAIAFAGGGWRAVWVAQVQALRPFGLWRVLVDARDGSVVALSNLAHTATVNAFPNCPELGTYGPVTLTDLTSATTLSGSYLDIYSQCVPFPGFGTECLAKDRQSKPNAQGNFLYKPAEPSGTDPFAEGHTYFHLTQMHDFFVSQGFDKMSDPIKVAVNFTLEQSMACNAGYTNDSIVVGLCKQMGAAVNFAYDSQIVMHEYTHGAVDRSSQLASYELDEWGLLGMPGGLNEAYADFFPAVVLDYPLVGHHVARAMGQGTALRDLDQVKRCPDDLQGEVHEDGKIWSSANWAAYKATSKDPQLVKVVFQALIALNSRASFKEAALATLSLATGTQKAALQAAYSAQGLLGCGRDIGINNGQTLQGLLLNPQQQLGILSNETPFIAQFKLFVPPTATSLKVDISGSDMLGGDAVPNLEVYANFGSHVLYGPNTSADWSSNGQPTLTVAAPRSGVYFFLVVGGGFGTSNSPGYTFRITPSYLPDDSGPDAGAPGLDAAQPAGPDAAAPGPDAGAAAGPDAAAPAGMDASVAALADAGAAESKSGCGCGSSSTGSAGLLAAIAALLALRRRRAEG